MLLGKWMLQHTAKDILLKQCANKERDAYKLC
jgi:hypothetical protein